MGIKKEQNYMGFEQGPIRPPSEANSLLLRVTRNCPWNRCTFCSVYKQQQFSLRLVEHVIADIEAIYEVVYRVLDELNEQGHLTQERVNYLAENYFADNIQVFSIAVNWLARGEGSVFLQDANSLIIKPDNLITILKHLKMRFPWISRITSYARSHTINRISDDKLAELAETGLNRIHIGMESGCDEVLKLTDKGVTKAHHIKAGQAVKKAGIELSEYVMPGLGGADLSSEHAYHTADALNQIDADFIRLRTLAIPPNIPLYQDYQSGEFKKCTDLQIILEIHEFVTALTGISSTLASDHFYNLLQEVDGKLPDDKPRMLEILEYYMQLPPDEQSLYQLGRRLGYFQSLADLEPGVQRRGIESVYEKLQVTPDNIDMIVEKHMLKAI
ncbi:MAG: radical SAM protein [Pseudomonadales bacterium]|jgi:hypothetical protein|nr:coproporphyrinogen III oxidase [Gammaproteobacteria bacterium]MDP6024677.1 radical SAM protein [Pseudomonadales bacterium]MDP7451249.1 radical SAM protein [Arenicellales bacterium]MDP6315001.1 radical SAM protein [Pseudomonadales bacterium]MDP7316106.1 radical SAM protein [Pseudomonadales bacterium]|tara:strand:+ start:4540 stop:5700 length:1161 start_codon:yes stop_codon:yes gene_type:complete